MKRTTKRERERETGMGEKEIERNDRVGERQIRREP